MSTEGMKHDQDKLRYDLIGEHAQRELVAVLTYGAIKYEAGNWRTVSDAQERYYGALLRHLSAYRIQQQSSLDGADSVDEESGLSHLAHALCCLHFLLQIESFQNKDAFDERFENAMKKAHELRAARMEKEAAK